jgi:hypothetical protein
VEVGGLRLMALDKGDPFPGLLRKALFKRAPVTKQINHSVTADISGTRKRGRPLKGEVAMTDAQRQRASRARKRITNPPKRITALQGD